MRKGAILAIAVLVSSISASATPIYTAWQSLTTGLLQANNTTLTALTFNKFNPGVGQTLQQVEFRLTGYGEAGYSVTTKVSGTTTFTYQGAMNVILNTPVTSSAITVSPLITDSTRSLTQVGTTTKTYSTPSYPLRTLTNTTAPSPIGIYTDLATLAAFTGAGTVNVTTKANINSQFNANNDLTTSVISRYKATVEVRYLYNEVSDVPEPTTTALAGVGLLALSWLSVRFNKSRQ